VNKDPAAPMPPRSSSTRPARSGMGERSAAGYRRARDYRRMTPEDFVLAINKAAFDSAVTDTIHKLKAGPPGRGAHPRGSALSLWYSERDADDQRMVLEIVRDAAHAVVFGVLCVLDGARVIDDPPHLDLRLTATGQQGRHYHDTRGRLAARRTARRVQPARPPGSTGFRHGKAASAPLRSPGRARSGACADV
jgi:hypothetical protein